MLKAVRFEEKKHKDLIDFIDNYVDKNNRPNHSEAIRFLMYKGLESLNNPPQPIVEQQSTIDVEALKRDIFNQIMFQINTMNINQNPIQHQQLNNNQIEQEISSEPKIQQTPMKQTEQLEKLKSVKSKSNNSNPLLANILGNINR